LQFFCCKNHKKHKYIAIQCNREYDLLQTAPISEIIKIGETLTILVYIKDNENQYDIRVRDCWAYDGEDYESPDTHKLQLTDTEGCPK
jgi:hypothetical protein